MTRTHRLHVKLPPEDRSYPIYIGGGLLERLGGLMSRVIAPGKTMIISDTRVFDLYGPPLRDALQDEGFQVSRVVFPPGERSKALTVMKDLYAQCLAFGMERRSSVIALGGGVVGDTAGFLAATLFRGVRYVQVPTTLLAQVDSSVGGKVGVNHRLGKNLIGAFYQPHLVLADLDTLTTLSDREYAAGMAEVIKYGVIRDARLFSRLESHKNAIRDRKAEVMLGIVRTCCRIKADVVMEDEKESGVRAMLNYGHTLGHAIESVTAYGRYLHGEAISIGMIAASHLAAGIGLLHERQIDRQKALLTFFGLPIRLPRDVSRARILKAVRQDKKVRAGKLRFVLPDRIGHVIMTDRITETMIRDALQKVSA